MSKVVSRSTISRTLGPAALATLALAGAHVPARASTAEPAKPYTRNVAIVLYEGVELLDFAGPGEVFQAAGSLAEHRGKRAFNVYTVATSTKPVTSQRFLTVVPAYAIDDAPKPDIIVIPGCGSSVLTSDPKFMAWAAKAGAAAEITLTVCTGAFVPARAGMLDGRTATTWYGATDRLREAAPKATVQDGRRFVDNGSIITTAGVSAGIDGALHAVARLAGRAVADRTARYMEYHWTPEPYLAKAYPYLNPGLDTAGRAEQQAELLAEEKDYAGAAAAFRVLGESAPADGWLRYRLACMYALEGRKGDALRALEAAVAAGYRDRDVLLGDPDLAALRSDEAFKKLVAAL
jgi:putative intracellular protease/amidase